MTGEIREGYGRDENNLSRAETPFYKGDSSDDGRDEAIFAMLLLFLKFSLVVCEFLPIFAAD